MEILRVGSKGLPTTSVYSSVCFLPSDVREQQRRGLSVPVVLKQKAAVLLLSVFTVSLRILVTFFVSES